MKILEAVFDFYYTYVCYYWVLFALVIFVMYRMRTKEFRAFHKNYAVAKSFLIWLVIFMLVFFLQWRVTHAWKTAGFEKKAIEFLYGFYPEVSIYIIVISFIGGITGVEWRKFQKNRKGNE